MAHSRKPLAPYRPIDLSALRRLPAALPGWFRISAETYLAYGRQRLSGGRNRSEPFLILAMGRSGSNLLASLLRCHPDIDCEGEILSRRIIGYTPCPHVWLQGRKALHHRPRYGFKLKYYHLTTDQRVHDPSRFLATLAGEGWKIIHLRRRNLLRQSLSNLRLIRTGKAQHLRSDRRVEGRMVVDVDWIVEQMRVRKMIGEQEDAALARLPHLPLIYEDDLEDAGCHQDTAEKIFASLGVPPVRVHTALAKAHVGGLREIIANYEEVHSALASTPYAHYLNE